jgi:hypothetical protein
LGKNLEVLPGAFSVQPVEDSSEPSSDKADLEENKLAENISHIILGNLYLF